MNNRYAQDDYEAARRFENYKSQDPFPEIQAALLNSADVDDYVAATGMICPFDPKKLKTATYAMDFEGKAYYWNENGEDESKPIEKGDTFKLRKNSIAFINLKAKFRIPNYIALRFNLGITHVHRGILLGTGPLIDPGF
ncbi:MAG: hypothetical protein ACE5H1_01410, partial [Thermodesulfobacteriota bacterium]